MAGCLFVLGVLFLLVGFIQLISPSRTVSQSPGIAPKTSPEHIPSKSVLNQAITTASQPIDDSHRSEIMANTPPLEWILIGERIQIKHPINGMLTLHVLGKGVFSELWQTSRGSQSPWMETGSAYSSFWLETNRLLLNWQNRFYILDERTYVTDNDIQRDFAPHARKFGESDQTANVYFEYPPAVWHIDDIGKFKIRQIFGEGFSDQMGSTARFIHASGDSQRALIVTDFEGSVGKDTVWIGYQILEQDIQRT
jgi:hypothetical protein